MTADTLEGMADGLAHMLKTGLRSMPVAVLEIIAVDQLFSAAGQAQHDGSSMDAVCLGGVGILTLVVMLIGHAAHAAWHTNE